MRSYTIQGEIDLEALDRYLRGNYPVEILLSVENLLKFKIFGFYRLFPFELFILDEAIVSIEHIEKSGSTNVTFSLLTSFFIALVLFSVVATFIAATSCGPKNLGEFFIFCLFFFYCSFRLAFFGQGSSISV
jgi:hypothetical protein